MSLYIFCCFLFFQLKLESSEILELVLFYYSLASTGEKKTADNVV